jgi:hypothetical protein
VFSPILAFAQDVTCDFHAIIETLLVKYVTDVILYSPNTNLEFGCYFLVTQTARDGDRNAILGIRQRFVVKAYRRVVDARSADKPRYLRMRSFHSIENSGYDCNQLVWLERFRQVGIDPARKPSMRSAVWSFAVRNTIGTSAVLGEPRSCRTSL